MVEEQSKKGRTGITDSVRKRESGDRAHLVVKVGPSTDEFMQKVKDVAQKSIDETAAEYELRNGKEQLEQLLPEDVDICDNIEHYTRIMNLKKAGYAKLIGKGPDVVFVGPVRETDIASDVRILAWYVMVKNAPELELPDCRELDASKKIVVYAPRDREALAFVNLSQFDQKSKKTGDIDSKIARDYLEECLPKLSIWLSTIREVQSVRVEPKPKPKSLESELSVLDSDLDELFAEEKCVPELEELAKMEELVRKERVESQSPRVLENYINLFTNMSVVNWIKAELTSLAEQLEAAEAEPKRAEQLFNIIKGSLYSTLGRDYDERAIVPLMRDFRALTLLGWPACAREMVFGVPIEDEILNARAQIIKKYRFDPAERIINFGESTIVSRFGSITQGLSRFSDLLPNIMARKGVEDEQMQLASPREFSDDEIARMIPRDYLFAKRTEPEVYKEVPIAPLESEEIRRTRKVLKAIVPEQQLPKSRLEPEIKFGQEAVIELKPEPPMAIPKATQPAHAAQPTAYANGRPIQKFKIRAMSAPPSRGWLYRALAAIAVPALAIGFFYLMRPTRSGIEQRPAVQHFEEPQSMPQPLYQPPPAPPIKPEGEQQPDLEALAASLESSTKSCLEHAKLMEEFKSSEHLVAYIARREEVRKLVELAKKQGDDRVNSLADFAEKQCLKEDY